MSMVSVSPQVRIRDRVRRTVDDLVGSFLAGHEQQPIIFAQKLGIVCPKQLFDFCTKNIWVVINSIEEIEIAEGYSQGARDLGSHFNWGRVNAACLNTCNVVVLAANFLLNLALAKALSLPNHSQVFSEKSGRVGTHRRDVKWLSK